MQSMSLELKGNEKLIKMVLNCLPFCKKNDGVF